MEQLNSLSKKKILLTGASGKLGQHYIEVLTNLDATVIAVDVNKKKLSDIADKYNKKFISERVIVRETDISNKKKVKNLFLDIEKKYGHIDILINNAAYSQTEHIKKGKVQSFEEFSDEVWQNTLDVNLSGVFYCCQEAGKHMIKKGKGVILNISSIYGFMAADQRIYGKSGQNSNIAYAVSKAGLINMSRYLASYWQGKNIRVNSLSPGGVYNNQDPEFVKNYKNKTITKRMAEPKDLSSALVYLISDASDYVTGFNLVVDGGFTAW